MNPVARRMLAAFVVVGLVIVMYVLGSWSGARAAVGGPPRPAGAA